MISGGHFVHDVFSSFLPPFLPLLIDKFGLSMVLAGSLTVFFRLPSLLNPLFGVISDRVDLRHVAIGAPAFTAVTMSLLGVAPNYAILCLCLLVAGMSASIFHVLGPVMISRVASENLGRGMSFWTTGGELARATGPLVAVQVVSILTFEGSYPVMVGGILASAFLYMNVNEIGPGSVQRQEGSLRETLRALRRVMAPLSGIMICRAFLVATLAAFLPTYMVGLGKSLWIGGASLAVFQLSGTMGTLSGGTASDRVGRRAVLLATLPTSSLLILAFVYAHDRMQFPILFFLGYFVYAFTPVNMAILLENSGKHTGTANGIYMTIHFITTAGATVLVGWLADLVSLGTAFTACALLGFAGIPIIFFLPKSRKIAKE